MNYLIESLGACDYESPLGLSKVIGDNAYNFLLGDERIIIDDSLETWKRCREENNLPDSFELAGPLKQIFFCPDKVKAAIVTCGGLCPGLNDVIRSLVMILHYHYKVRTVLGIRYGYQGMTWEKGGTAVPLTPDLVKDIHTRGGTFLGSSRGTQNTVEVVDFLQRRDIRILFTIGGDGTIRGALDIAKECSARNYKASIIGIPKTIDNDIAYIDRSFGFLSAVEKAKEVIDAAHAEARGAENGIGLVKLMGRHSGYIAAQASLASGEANVVLIPEIPFDLEGPKGLLQWLKKRLEDSRHALIVVAEGAGQDLFATEKQTLGCDPSGNKRLADIGLLLKERITDYLSHEKINSTLKYFDPSYLVRSTRANAADSMFCFELAQNAVHAAMAGKTCMIAGTWHNSFVNIPMELAVSRRKILDPEGPEWFAVVENTGQPPVFKNS